MSARQYLHGPWRYRSKRALNGIHPRATCGSPPTCAHTRRRCVCWTRRVTYSSATCSNTAEPTATPSLLAPFKYDGISCGPMLRIRCGDAMQLGSCCISDSCACWHDNNKSSESERTVSVISAAKQCALSVISATTSLVSVLTDISARQECQALVFCYTAREIGRYPNTDRFDTHEEATKNHVHRTAGFRADPVRRAH
jgi:hypothetical protein